jgi:Ni,Fe-hydrogenase III small subunit
LALAEPLLLTAPLTDQQRSATRHALEQLPQRSIFASMIRSTRLGRLFQLPACVSCRAPFFLQLIIPRAHSAVLGDSD